MNQFDLHEPYKPAGDQPQAIDALVAGIHSGARHQTLLGATGTGKTYTIAHTIARVQKPTLVIAHNKTLAAQLAAEFREFFPHNAVRYFVSYYDYYQPEAYMPVTDTYIEKEAMINEEIDRMRHATTQALLSRNDVIVVASVSAIYGLGKPSEYARVVKRISVGTSINRSGFVRELVELYFVRTNADLKPGTFRAVGNHIEIMPTHARDIIRLTVTGTKVSRIEILDAITRTIVEVVPEAVIFPAKHFVTAPDTVDAALHDIEAELKSQLAIFKKEKKLLEADRLTRRTRQDLALIREIGYCNGIENYSRHFDRRVEGEAPSTLLSYLHQCDPDFLTVIDESHVTLPQLQGMYAGDRARKNILVEHGFRLPSAKDNRPLRFEEFNQRVGQCVYVSATPGGYELTESTPAHVVEQIIRPTGLVDPAIEVRPVTATADYAGQVRDSIAEAVATTQAGARTLVTVLTKKMAEDLTDFLKEQHIKAEYVHSDIKTAERITILTRFRKGEFDVLVGVNLLREGLDLPEVELVAILDADKEGFLRSETSLIQTIGRAARNVHGRVLLYGDIQTGSMSRAIAETNRRREKQIAYNKAHKITPKTIQKAIKDITDQFVSAHKKAVHDMAVLDKKGAKNKRELGKLITEKRKQMKDAAVNLDFETAALLRDEIALLEQQ
jgi:excinuclease ABC subunit B